MSNPEVNLALKAIPGGKYISLGVDIWKGLFSVASKVKATGANGSADLSWSAVDSVHQEEMLALTGDIGYNRIVNVDCKQVWDDNWLASPGHYIYLDALIKSTGAVKLKWLQYSYQFEICRQNGIGYFYTIKTVNDFFYRRYCR